MGLYGIRQLREALFNRRMRKNRTSGGVGALTGETPAKATRSINHAGRWRPFRAHRPAIPLPRSLFIELSLPLRRDIGA